MFDLKALPMGESENESVGEARNSFMTRLMLLTVLAATLSLACACAPRTEPAAASDEPAKSSTSDAGKAFATFMNNPTSQEGWRGLCRAAAEGHIAAQYTIAVRYRDGLPPVTRNLTRAYLWFSAARQGGLSAAAIARDDLEKSMTEDQLAEMRAEGKTVGEADCTETEN